MPFAFFKPAQKLNQFISRCFEINFLYTSRNVSFCSISCVIVVNIPVQIYDQFKFDGAPFWCVFEILTAEIEQMQTLDMQGKKVDEQKIAKASNYKCEIL